MKTFLRVVLGIAVLTLGSERAWAHHVNGSVYCDEDSNGAINTTVDRPLDGVTARCTSNIDGQTYTDITGDNVPPPIVPGFYYMQLLVRSDDLKCELVGLPAGLTVKVPVGGSYPNLPIVTGDPARFNQENINFLLDGCQICGNGVLADGEDCDDGTANSDTTPGACRTDCTKPACGDGIIDPGEQCDDGNTDNNDACRNDCTTPRCGDGVTDPGEQCDNGANNSDTTPGACRTDCTKCGDGLVQPEHGEQCEPPNAPGCDANCHAAEVCNDFVDNNGDGLIDCFDPGCECGPIGRDPGAIRFGPTTGTDLFAVHGSFVPTTAGIDPANEIVGIRLTNTNGETKIFEIKIAPGTLRKIGRNFYRFRDRAAQRNRSGLARLDVRYLPTRHNWTFLIKAYGDLSKATKAKMDVQWVVGDDAFLNQSDWLSIPQGWLLTLP